MRRPIPVESLIITLLKDKKEIGYNDLLQALKAWYPDINDKEVRKALMKLELSKLIIVERSRKEQYYIRLR